MAEFNVYGIRHHGPGSARALAEALDANPPDVLCVEMPADFAPAVAEVGNEALVPPVALVAYDPKSVSRALYYPLARFSPEWVAMRWAAARDVAVVPVDLPAPLMMASGARAHPVRVDPLGAMAAAAGYDDRERWWERTFELRNPGAAAFAPVSAMIAALREAYPEAVDRDCRLREAHMARAILAQLRGGERRVAVVCGAWHAPVLAKAELKITARGYAALRKGLKGPRLESTWIPWTYDRLRTGAGYGAGVESPVWYDLLYEDPATAPEHYLTLAARELRGEGFAASPAQVIDAAELAEGLRRLRGLDLAGLQELRAAALGTLAGGSEERLRAIGPGLESLATTGRVPEGSATLPLLRDLVERLKATRLHAAYRDMSEQPRVLDLRKPRHLAASQLLWQLTLLGIPFGAVQEGARGAQGTFAEHWRLRWRPEYALRLLAAHPYGQRVAEAAAAKFTADLGPSPTLETCAAAADRVILAGLFDSLADVADLIRARAIDAVDAWAVARSLGPLLRLARYSSLRSAEASYLRELTGVLLPKLCAGLAAASAGVDDEAAFEGFHVLRRLQPDLGLESDPRYARLWERALSELAFGTKTHRLLAGFALRSLADRDLVTGGETSRWLTANLRGQASLAAAGHCVEGFLHSSATVLLHQPAVFDALDAWLSSLGADQFRRLLPALRRTAAAFPVHERRKLSARARGHESRAGGDCAETLPDELSAALRSWLSPAVESATTAGVTEN